MNFAVIISPFIFRKGKWKNKIHIMKNLVKIGFGLIIGLGAAMISFTFSTSTNFNFLIAGDYGIYANYFVGIIAVLVLSLIRHLNQKQLLGLGLFLTFLPFSVLHKSGKTTWIILDYQPLAGVILFMIGLGMLIYRQLWSTEKITEG